MTILVNELRLSLVWNKAYAKDSLLPYLADSNRYIAEFDKAVKASGDWRLPWKAGEQQNFWKYYLFVSEIGDLMDVDGERAWRYLMPICLPNLLHVSAPEGFRITFEGYGFPHSVGVMATLFVKLDQPLSLLDTVERVVEARLTDYDVSWRGSLDDEPAHGSLDNLADALMDRLHQNLLGKTPHGKPLSSPLTIATVIDASNFQEGDNQDKSEIERALFGLCLLEKGWQTAQMKSGGLNKGLKPEDYYYRAERAYAIWMPRHFTETIPKIKRRSLGCYHRNQSLAALQTRSLLTLIRRAFEFSPRPVSGQLSQPVQWAFRLLNDLYLGEYTTYRSISVVSHIYPNLKKLILPVGEVIGEEWREERLED